MSISVSVFQGQICHLTLKINFNYLKRSARTDLTWLVIRKIVIAEPDPQWCPLELRCHKGIKLQRGTQTSAFFSLELDLQEST